MKTYILASIKLTIVTIIFFAVIYPLIVLGIAQFAPNQGKGIIVEHNGKTYYRNIGQSFTREEYFWSRPSSIDYKASSSGGSNKGASNAAYLVDIQARVDAFLAHKPKVEKSEIPVDMITQSGSGLDPDFSVQAAKVQVNRIAQKRNLEASKLYELINQHKENAVFGLFGPEKINVLELNIALDELSNP